MTYYYSPHTGEHIVTNDPADWMDSTEIAPPAHDATQSAVFVDGAWTIVSPQPPEPPPPKQFTSLEFLDLFTEAEQLAVAGAAMTSAAVKLWYDKMLAAGFVTISDPRTEAGLNALVSADLLTAERKAAIVEAMS